ncbi:amidohydrolase family protein [Parvularcula sp. ZS-1/3]|uniref:Amidohydrolase family protein n=1 Tax=Parvularcula mediterranea TaxID=2732508 RepID=A0A7Y3W608_9PROT|nr:amidohydrolase family protein [Parvularcula mediterranea]NNU17184.1 amidohydrolase family protein [Parvularcula mediterranea]
MQRAAVFLAGVAAAGLAACAHPASGPDLIVENARLFDPRTGDVSDGQSIIVDDGFIVEVRPTTASERARKVIDAGGRLVTPGFIDTHVHFQHQFHDTRDLSPPDRTRLGRMFTAYGVTTVADMGQPQAWIPELVRWQKESVHGSPDVILVAGSIGSTHEWDPTPPPHHDIVANPEEARALVGKWQDLGADRIKLYWKLEKPELDAAADEIAKRGMTAYAHLDNGITSISDGLDAGVRHFEHTFTTYRTIIDPDDLLPMISERMEFSSPRGLDEWTRALSLYHDEVERRPDLKSAFDALLDRMAEEEASLSTALNILAAHAGSSPVYASFDAFPPRTEGSIREEWVSEETARDAFKTILAQLKRAHDNGVMLRIGTDAGNGGASLLAEMMLLTEAGIPVEDVLRIGTLNGAETLGIEDSAGIIEAGRPADFVLFDEDPFEDAAHFRSGLTVIDDGAVYEPQPSPVPALEARLRTDGAEAVGGSVNLEGAHAIEVSAAVMRFLQKGDIDNARFLMDRIGPLLSGEEPGAYLEVQYLWPLTQGLLSQGRPEDAIAVARFGTEVHGESGPSLEVLGNAQANGGDVLGAKATFERALAANPDSRQARSALEQINGYLEANPEAAAPESP